MKLDRAVGEAGGGERHDVDERAGGPAGGATVVRFPTRVALAHRGEGDRIAAEPVAPFRTLAISSGKGGVGKTNLVANLAISLARRGQRVIVLDADLGLANLDTVLGLHPWITWNVVSPRSWWTGRRAFASSRRPAGSRT